MVRRTDKQKAIMYCLIRAYHSGKSLEILELADMIGATCSRQSIKQSLDRLKDAGMVELTLVNVKSRTKVVASATKLGVARFQLFAPRKGYRKPASTTSGITTSSTTMPLSLPEDELFEDIQNLPGLEEIVSDVENCC